MLLHLLAHRCAAARPAVLGSGGTSGGGGGGGDADQMFSSTHLPRITGEVRSACEVTVRMLPLPEQPLACLVGHGHAAEVAAVDAGMP